MFLLSDLFSLLIAFLYVAGVIAISETLRRIFHISLDITRKIVHVGVGMTALVVTSFFRDWYIAILGPLAFIAINYLSYRKKIFQGIEIAEEGQLGTVYFPLSFVLLTPLLWSQPALLAASFMPMTWGDAAAAILGKRFGAHQFRLLGQGSAQMQNLHDGTVPENNRKGLQFIKSLLAIFLRQRASSVEGSIAMFLFGFIATDFALMLFGHPLESSIALGFVTAIIAMIAEALSPKGIDNLSVPLASAMVLAVLAK